MSIYFIFEKMQMFYSLFFTLVHQSIEMTISGYCHAGEIQPLHRRPHANKHRNERVTNAIFYRPFKQLQLISRIFLNLSDLAYLINIFQYKCTYDFSLMWFKTFYGNFFT